jgi:hypothetical protein
LPRRRINVLRKFWALWPARTWKSLFWVATVVCLFMALRPGGGGPMLFAGQDKLEHAGAFAVLTWLGLHCGWRHRWSLGLGLLAFGIAIEFAQYFTATRQADVWDAVADAVGIALALGLDLWRASGRQEREHRG